MQTLKYALAVLAGVACPFILGGALYVLWSIRGKNTGWPT